MRALVALIATLAIGLAVALAWTALTLNFPHIAFWWALPAGAFIGYVMHAWVVRARPMAVLLTIFAMALATVCMSGLYMGARVADTVELGYLHTLLRAGPHMLLILAGNLLTHSGHLAIAIGMALAIILALRRRKDGTA